MVPPQLNIFLTEVVDRILLFLNVSAMCPPMGTIIVITRCGSADRVPVYGSESKKHAGHQSTDRKAKQDTSLQMGKQSMAPVNRWESKVEHQPTDRKARKGTSLQIGKQSRVPQTWTRIQISKPYSTNHDLDPT